MISNRNFAGKSKVSSINTRNGKLEVDIRSLTLLFCFSIIYIIPISSTLSLSSGEHGTIYYYLRLLMLPLAILCLVIDAKTKTKDLVEYAVLFILAISAYFINKEIPATSLIILTSIILFDQILKKPNGLNPRFIRRGAIIHLLQIGVMSYLFFQRYGYLGIINSGKDPNYTAYFLIILYFMFGNESAHKIFQLRDVFLILSIFTWSRTAVLAIIVIYLCRIFNFNNSKISVFVTNHPLLVFLVAEILWLIINKIFVLFFLQYDYVYQFRQGADRFSTLIDGSNYMRAAMNSFLVEDMNLKKLLLGYTTTEYNLAILTVISRVNNPHNTILAIYLQSGMIYAFAIIRRATRLFSGRKFLGTMFLIYLIYSLILGPSTYYGVELVILLIATFYQKEKMENSDETKEN